MNNEKLQSLLESADGLTDEFKQSIQPIFEEAIQEALAEKDSEIQALKEELEAEKENNQSQMDILNQSVDEMVTEGVQAKTGEINEKINKYLEYVVEDFVKTHEQELIEREVSSISESFLKDLGSIYTKYGVKTPEPTEEEISVIDSLKEEVSKAYDTIYALTEKRDSLEEEVSAYRKETILGMVAEEHDLTTTQFDKLAKLVEGFDGTLDAFKERASEIAEQMLEEDTSFSSSVVSETTPILEEVQETTSCNAEVDAIAESLLRFNRKSK